MTTQIFNLEDLKKIFVEEINKEEFARLKNAKNKILTKLVEPFSSINEKLEKVEKELNEEKKVMEISKKLFSFMMKDKKFWIHKIKEGYTFPNKIEKIFSSINFNFISLFEKTIKTNLFKYPNLINLFLENEKEILEKIFKEDKEGLWSLIGKNICDLLLEKKSNDNKPIEVQAETVLQKAFDNSVELEEAKKSLEEKFNKKLSELETKERNLDKQRESLEERLNAIALVEEKYSNLLKELESKSSNLATENNSEEPEKITGEAVIATPIMPEVVEVEKESKVDYSMDGFSATESAVIKHMEDILRHKKGTQNIWIDDETDREHTFLSTIKISRGVKIISDKKEILDYYKESRNVEKI